MTSTMTKDAYAETARELGRLAFEEGRPCVPALDRAMMDLIAENQDKPFGSAIAPLQEYQSGWIQANLAAPMPDEDEYDGPLDGWDNAAYSAAAYGGSTFRACTHGYPPSECPTCNRVEL